MAVGQVGRPDRVTGLQLAYQAGPRLDATLFLVNRMESETTHDSFDDDNEGKTVGGRIGWTPAPASGLLPIGLGGFYGPEQEGRTGEKRWPLDLDATVQSTRDLLFAADLLYGAESNVARREVGTPVPAPAATGDANGWGGYLLAHYDATRWLGLSVRYGDFDDDGARTGVAQRLRSVTLAPVVHLPRLVPGLAPTGATYACTRHPIAWVDLALEYRYNRPNRPVFSDEEPNVAILAGEQESHEGARPGRRQLLAPRAAPPDRGPRTRVEMYGVYLSRLPLSAKVFCTLFLVGIGLGALAAFTQAFTAVGLTPAEV
ncbi:MAG TPA: outer membrane beta-barrel protein [Thermodesulfobacteriota bacterium]|nr:outer membrane beta-barrel protein [Thermodesulfobacteriota bacterium]